MAGTCNYFILMVRHAISANIRQPHAKATDSSFATVEEKSSNFNPTNKEVLLLWPIKAEHSPGSGQQGICLAILNKHCAVAKFAIDSELLSDRDHGTRRNIKKLTRQND